MSASNISNITHLEANDLSDDELHEGMVAPAKKRKEDEENSASTAPIHCIGSSVWRSNAKQVGDEENMDNDLVTHHQASKEPTNSSRSLSTSSSASPSDDDDDLFNTPETPSTKTSSTRFGDPLPFPEDFPEDDPSPPSPPVLTETIQSNCLTPPSDEAYPVYPPNSSNWSGKYVSVAPRSMMLWSF